MREGTMETVRRVVARNGRVSLPVEFRRRLGIQEGDLVEFILEDGTPRLKPSRSPVDESSQAVPPLSRPFTWKEIEEIAHEEHAQEAAREGLDAWCPG
jgi:AbrB family looped-hinge helix DNA binding protein